MGFANNVSLCQSLVQRCVDMYMVSLVLRRTSVYGRPHTTELEKPYPSEDARQLPEIGILRGPETAQEHIVSSINNWQEPVRNAPLHLERR